MRTRILLICALAALASGCGSTGQSSGPTGAHVVDGSGKAVVDGSNECVAAGHAHGQGHPADCDGAAAAEATPAAPPPEVTEPLAAAAEPAPVEAAQPEPTSPPTLEKLSLQADALFAFGKSDLGSPVRAGRDKLDALAARIQQIDAAAISAITVTGHADRIGTTERNLALSERRAETVKNYLVNKGVNAQWIQAIGKGESEPLVQCKGDKATSKLIACLAANRRVEVVVLGK